MNASDVFEHARRLIDNFRDYEGAAEALRWAQELEPENAQVLWLLATTLVKIGEHEDAREILLGLAPDVDDADEVGEHALARAACFDFEGAVRLLTHALERDPTNPTLYARRGLIQFHASDYDQAANDLVRAAIVGEYGLTLGGGDFKVLFGGFKRIKDEGSRTNSLLLIDAWASLMKGKPRRTLALLGRLPRDARGSWQAIGLRAACSRKRDDKRAKEREKEFVAKALEAAPEEVSLLVLRLRDLSPLEVEEQRLVLDRILRRAPNWFGGLYEATSLANRLRDYAAALIWADRALEVYPDSPDSLACRAEAQVGRHDFAAALVDLDAALEIYEQDSDEVSQIKNAQCSREPRPSPVPPAGH